MAQYPKPSGSSGTFNNGNFNNNQTGGLTIAEGLKYFVSFPKTQTPSTITANNFTTTGNLDVAGDSQFGGDVNFLGGVSITGGIVFKDDVEVQGTTTLDQTLLCLNDATIDGELTITNNVILEPSALTPTVAPYLQLTNGVANEYCQLYLDPQVGYDMTLYTNQTSGGGLTIRGANGASFTMNPDSVQGGYGCKFINPVDMNGYQLSGLTNVYADGSVMTFIDSASSPMLQLTNGGHTSYENINMNNNTIYGASSISSPIFYVSTYGKIDQSGTNNGVVVANNAPYVNGAQATIAFNLNSPTGITTPFKIYNDGLNSIVNLNMNNANINGINTLTGYAGGNITLGSYINMNSNNILNCGSGSTAYTQATADSDSSIATTAFVHNVVNAIPTVQFTTTTPAGQVSVGNLNQSATSLTTVKNGVNTSIVYNSGNLSFNSTATASLLGSYINFPANTLYPSSIGTPTITSNTSYVIITSASGTGMTYPVSIASITPTGFLFTASNIIQATYSLYLNFTLNY